MDLFKSRFSKLVVLAFRTEHLKNLVVPESEKFPGSVSLAYVFLTPTRKMG
jgi:hypothetical protein